MTSASTQRQKSRQMCQLRPAPSPPPGPFKLFVKFPSETEDPEDTRVHTLVIESESVSVTAMKARIELTHGLAANCYELRYGEKTLKESDRLRLGRDLNDGSLLTACACTQQIRCVAEAVYRQDADLLQDLCGFTCIRDRLAVQRKCQPNIDCRPPKSLAGGCSEVVTGRDGATGVCLIVDTELAFVAMCLASAVGHYEIVQTIGNADGDGSLRKLATPFGRTPLHIACANDNDRVTNLLLALNYNPLAADGCKRTPISMAQRFEAGLCSMLIRRHEEKCRRQRQQNAESSCFNGDEWFENTAAVPRKKPTLI